jgi:hypothetical protein
MKNSSPAFSDRIGKERITAMHLVFNFGISFSKSFKKKTCFAIASKSFIQFRMKQLIRSKFYL